MQTRQANETKLGRSPGDHGERPTGQLSRRTLIGLTIASVVSGALVVLLLVRLISAGTAAGGDPVSPLAGKPAPDFTITTWNGVSAQQVRLADLKGKPVVVNFWASWCDPCREETPVLQAAWQKYQGSGVMFVGVAMRDKQSDGAAFLKQYGVTYPSGPDTTGQITIDYGVTGPPETVFIDRHGVVVSKTIGAIDDGSLDKAIQGLLKG